MVVWLVFHPIRVYGVADYFKLSPYNNKFTGLVIQKIEPTI